MVDGYFTDKEGCFVRPIFGSGRGVVAVTTFKHLPLRLLSVSYSSETTREMNDLGYKFIKSTHKEEIDYEELLRKYIDYVIFNEGTDFIRDACTLSFTDEELKELTRLSENSKLKL